MTKRQPKGLDPLLQTPDAQAIANAATVLGLAMIDKCDELAKKLLGQFTNDPDLSSDGAGSVERFHGLHLELTKLRIRCAANMDLGGAVAAARFAGATWEQVGAACGTSKQAAYERWRKVVKEFEDARRRAEHRPVDALDLYDPAGEHSVSALLDVLEILRPGYAVRPPRGPDAERDGEVPGRP
jgi:hypothetical protein